MSSTSTPPRSKPPRSAILSPTPRSSAEREEEEWETYHPSLDSEDDLSVSASTTSTPKSPSRARRRIKVGVASSIDGSPRRNTPVKRKKQALKAVDTPPIPSPQLEPRPKPASTLPPSPTPSLTDTIIRYIALIIRPLIPLLKLTISITSISLSLLSPLISLLAPILLPLTLALTAILTLGLGTYIFLPRLPSFLVSIVASTIRSIVPISRWASGLTDLGVVRSTAIGPARVLVTPLCALLGLGCEYSLLSTLPTDIIDPQSEGYSVENGQVRLARPFWEWSYPSISLLGTRKGDVGVDVGRIARGLSREVVQARDVFESVQSLGAAGLVDSLHYVKIWELATAVGVGGNFPEKTIVGQELAKLGDLTRDLSDEITAIDHAAVSAFTWIQWEFTTLLDLLDSPTPPPNLTLSRRLDSLISQLDSAFTSLHTLTSSATHTAGLASQKGRSAVDRIEWIKHQIQQERDEHPIWKHAWDKNKHRLVGGELPRSEMLQRDLSLTKETITNLHEAKIHLERVRILTQGYRDQIGMTKARMVGYHIGAEGAGVGAEEEVRVLERLVGGLKGAVEGAKRRERSKGGGSGVREIGG